MSRHPDVEIIKFVLQVEGKEPEEIQVEGVDEFKVAIPEGSKYFMTIYFKALKDLKDFKYNQVVKKAGIVLKERDIQIGDYTASSEVYSKEFEPDVTPSGFFTRGTFPARSTYYANGAELYASDWTLEIKKK